MKPKITYTVHYPFGIGERDINNPDLAERASNLGLRVTAQTGYRVVG